MSIGPSRWTERRRDAQARQRRPSIRAAEVRPRIDARGYEVRIYGSHLVSPGVPTEIVIGDQRATRIRVDRDGTVRGVIEAKPDVEEILVRVGGEETRGRLKAVAIPARPELGRLRPRLSAPRRWIDRLRGGG